MAVSLAQHTAKIVRIISRSFPLGNGVVGSNAIRIEGYIGVDPFFRVSVSLARDAILKVWKKVSHLKKNGYRTTMMSTYCSQGNLCDLTLFFLERSLVDPKLAVGNTSATACALSFGF